MARHWKSTSSTGGVQRTTVSRRKIEAGRKGERCRSGKQRGQVGPQVTLECSRSTESGTALGIRTSYPSDWPPTVLYEVICQYPEVQKEAQYYTRKRGCEAGRSKSDRRPINGTVSLRTCVLWEMSRRQAVQVCNKIQLQKTLSPRGRDRQSEKGVDARSRWIKVGHR